MHFGGFFTILFFVIFVLVLIRIIGKAAAAMENSSQEERRSPSSPFAGLFAGTSRNESWMEAAHEFGLEYVRSAGMSGYPSLRGNVNDRLIEVHLQIEDSGVLQTVATAMFSRPLDAGILIVQDDPSVCARRFADRKVYRVTGLENPRLHCSAASPDALKHFLTRSRVNALKNALAFHRYFEIADRYVVVKFNGDGRNPEALSNLIEFTSSFAALLEEEGSPDAAASSVRSSPSDPIPVEACEPVPELKRPSRSPASAARPDSAPAPVPKPVAEPLAEPAVSVPEAPAEPVSAEPPCSADSEASGGALDQTAFAASLFSASFPGKRESEIFDAAKGIRVEWSGILRSAYPFGNDFVLGAGPAVKASFEIAEVTGMYSMKSKIRATVRLPESAMPLLKNHLGEPFRFSGVLEKMEPYAREFILLDGNLLSD